MDEKETDGEEKFSRYLIETLFELVQLGGETYKEKVVLDYLEKNLPEHVKKNAIRSENFGLFVVLPAKTKTKRTIIIDAHVDMVQETFIKPTVDNKGIITATGLDNRISVSVLLTLLKFQQFEDTNVVVLFSIEEETGYNGVKYFATQVNLKGLFGFEVFKVIVLDCTFGKLDKTGYFDPYFTTFSGKKFNIVRDFMLGDDSQMPVVSKGSCPPQPYGIELKVIKRLCNCDGFTKGYYKRAIMDFVSCPVIDMHHMKSYASKDDICDMYKTLVKKIL